MSVCKDKKNIQNLKFSAITLSFYCTGVLQQFQFVSLVAFFVFVLHFCCEIAWTNLRIWWASIQCRLWERLSLSLWAPVNCIAVFGGRQSQSIAAPSLGASVIAVRVDFLC